MTKTINGFSLTQGATKSCGCLKREAQRENLKIARKVWYLPDGVAARNTMLNRYRNNKRGHEFALSDEQFDALTSGDCHYCGSPPNTMCKPRSAKTGYLSNGIDRIDNSRGYVIENCVSCCRICNYAKRNMTADAFEAWILLAASHIKARKQQMIVGV